MAGKPQRSAPKGSAYDRITARILEHMEKGVVPWRQPWAGGCAPRNLDGKSYRGINPLLLNLSGYGSSRWGTYHAVQVKGGRVKPGEHGTTIYVSRPVTEEEAARRRERHTTERTEGKAARREEESPWITVSHVVFNLEQCEGIELAEEAAVPPRLFTPIESAEQIVEHMPKCPPISETGERAFYAPATDSITVPPRPRFKSDSGFYGTLFHELAHSTADKSRLGREVGGYSFSTHARSREELVAEMTASFLRAESGMEMEDDDEANSAAYIQDWIKQIRGDKTLVVQAAKAAQRAADFILGRAVAHAPSKDQAADETLKQAA